mgnify:CR=1 FL=1
MNMDVNLRRLPDNVMYYPKFPVPLAGFIEHSYPTDSADIQSKQRNDTLTSERLTPGNHMLSAVDKVSNSATEHIKTSSCRISKFHNRLITYNIKGGFL